MQINLTNWAFDKITGEITNIKKKTVNLHGVMRLHLRATVATPVTVWTGRHRVWREGGMEGGGRVREIEREKKRERAREVRVS